MKPCRGFVLFVAAGAAILVSALEARQTPPAHYALESPEGLRLHNVTAEPAVLQGKKGLKVTISDQAQRQLQQMSDAQQASFEQLALVGNLEFSSGEISAEIAGAPAPGAAEGARGFVGIAFRVQSDLKTYDAFYLRPTNGRADDQERRNHAAQYVSHPDWPWFRLRERNAVPIRGLRGRPAGHLDRDPDRGATAITRASSSTGRINPPWSSTISRRVRRQRVRSPCGWVQEPSRTFAT